MLPRLCVLVSFAYLRKDPVLSAVCRALAPSVDLMWDSGAFTDHFQYRKALLTGASYERITVDEYCDWLAEWAALAWGYVQLDVLTDDVRSQQNLEVMVKRGWRPMPVITLTEDPGRAREWVEISGKLCVAAIGKAPLPFAQQRIYRTWNACEGRGLIHALGFTRYPTLLRLPVHCADSSSWLSGGRYGNMDFFDAVDGFSGVSRPDLIADRDERERVIGLLRAMDMPAEYLAQRECWRGSAGVLRILSAHATLQMHAVMARAGRRLFLAGASTHDLTLMLSTVSAYDSQGALSIRRARETALRLGALGKSDKGALYDELAQIAAKHTAAATRVQDKPPAEFAVTTTTTRA